MGDRSHLRSDDIVPFVDPSQEDTAEVDQPDTVSHLLEADVKKGTGQYAVDTMY